MVAAEYFSADGVEIFEHELEQLRTDRKARFVAERMDQYERMWDGCGCRIDYYSLDW